MIQKGRTEMKAVNIGKTLVSCHLRLCGISMLISIVVRVCVHLEPSCFPKCLTVQQAVCGVLWGDPFAGCRPHVHGLWNPHHFWIPPRFSQTLEDRKMPHCQGTWRAEGTHTHAHTHIRQQSPIAPHIRKEFTTCSTSWLFCLVLCLNIQKWHANFSA